MIGEALAVAAMRLGANAPAVLARIGGPIGVAARAAVSDGTIGTRIKRASIMAFVRAPTPVGFAAVHATWIEAVLAPLPARARAAVAGHGGSPSDVWLARWGCAAMPPMTPPGERLGAAPEIITAWLEGIGADQLAFALGERGIAAIAPRLGSRGELLHAAAARIDPRVLGPHRAAIARCAGVPPDELALIRIGARALAPHLARYPLADRQLVLRLPRPLGRIVAIELAAHVRDSLETCPTWTALAGDW